MHARTNSAEKETHRNWVSVGVGVARKRPIYGFDRPQGR
jgi:hypothetical protein